MPNSWTELLRRCTRLKQAMTSIGFHPYQIFSRLPLWVIGPLLCGYYGDVWAELPQDLKVLFIHIPKTAGTSVTSALYGNSFGHRPASFYLAADKKRFRAITSFAIVRNPCDRYCSAFYQYLRYPCTNSWDRLVLKAFFRRFSKPIELAYALEAMKGVRNFYMSLLHARPQVDWIMAEGRIVVQHLFPFERLYLVEGFLREVLCDPDFCLPHTNSSQRAISWETELDNHAKRIIEDLYKDDTKLWDSLI